MMGRGGTWVHKLPDNIVFSLFWNHGNKLRPCDFSPSVMCWCVDKTEIPPFPHSFTLLDTT